jgi:hypothetical protein
VEEDEGAESKKSPGLFSSIKKSLKRKQTDLSPEHAQSSSADLVSPRRNLAEVVMDRPRKKPSASSLLADSLYRTDSDKSQVSFRGEMYPPPSRTSSFRTQASQSSYSLPPGGNYETERLRLQLRESQEDLNRHQRTWEAERAIYEAEIAELRGGGSFGESSGKGKRRGY